MLPAKHRILTVCLASVLGAAGLLMSLRLWPSSSDGPSTAGASEAHRSLIPFHIPVIPIPLERWAAIRNSIYEFPSAIKYSAGLAHVLRLGRSVWPHQIVPTNNGPSLDALTIDTKAQQLFGHPLLSKTRHGVRFRPPSPPIGQRTFADESHSFQLLAVLAETGVRRDHPITLLDQKLTVQSIVEDAIATYCGTLREPEWLMVALVAYLPPQRTWRNRHGTVFGFDDIAKQLMARDPSRASCGGTHALYSLIVLLRSQASHRILSSECANAVEAYVKRSVASITASQRADGSWDAEWYMSGEVGRKVAIDDVGRLTITGHLAECLVMLPPGLRPPIMTYFRSAAYLWRRIDDVGMRPALVLCPWSHAVRALDFLRVRAAEEVRLP